MTKRSLNRLIVFCLLIVLLFTISVPTAGFAGSEVHSGAPGASNDAVSVLESNSQKLTIEVALPTYRLETAVSDQGSCSKVIVPGWNPVGLAGQPAVPARGLMVAVPLGSIARVSVVEAGPEQELGRFRLCPVPTILGNPDPSGGSAEEIESLRFDPEAYTSTVGYPATLAELGQPAFIRSQQVVQLSLRPFHYDPVNQVLKGVSSLRVQVEFIPDGRHVAQGGSLDEGSFEPELQGLLVNYQQARSWRVSQTEPILAPASIQTSQPAYKLAVAQNGLMKVTYAALQAAGLPLAINPRTFRLTNQGSEVAIFVQGENDNTFDPGDYLVFYGQKANTRYTDTNIYWLTWGGAKGLRMASWDGKPVDGSIPVTFRSTAHIEQNKSYYPSYSSGPTQDHWFWELILSSSAPVSKNYSFNLKNVAATPGETARVRGLLNGFAANPQHDTNIYINGHLIKSATWPAQAEYSFNLSVPQSYLLEGANTITVECPMTDGTNPILLDYVLVNWFEVEYAKTYQADGPQTFFNGDAAGTWKFELNGLSSGDQMIVDITNPLLPAHITGGIFTPNGGAYTLDFKQITRNKTQYLVVSPADMFVPASIVLAQAADLLSTSNSADYIIISHPDFLSAIQPLADYRTRRGLRVKVVNVIDIYDEFNGGVFDPQAIQRFISYTYSNWSRPAPLYILLVGDGNYDFMNYLGRNEPNYIPPFLAIADPWLGEIAADNRFVTVSGSDLLPDMAIGRLPVKTAQEVTNVVNKVLAYQGTTNGGWAKKALFVSGKNDPNAGYFLDLSNILAGEYGSTGVGPIDKIYYETTFSTPAATRAAILAAINAGRFLVHYSGHSSPLGWYGDVLDLGNSGMFNASNIPSLTNSGKLPFLVSMTCLVGNFNNPYLRPLDEALIISANVGTVASWSPVGKGDTYGHDTLDQGLIDAIYQKHIINVGQATMMAKYYLAATSPGNMDLLDTFVLLGDPALQLPVTQGVFFPLVIR